MQWFSAEMHPLSKRPCPMQIRFDPGWFRTSSIGRIQKNISLPLQFLSLISVGFRLFAEIGVREKRKNKKSMAASASSLVSSLLFLNSFSSTTKRGFKRSELGRFGSFSTRSFTVSPRTRFPRGLFEVKATIMQDEEEEVVMEDSFQAKGFPNFGSEKIDAEGDESSSALEKWVIKFEQSINIFLIDTVIKVLDALYHDRDYARFFVLETIARVPYFAFMSVLHMYESFGWWRRADYLKVHFAESWNEMHHLLIMEELGGNAWWFDRFLSQHIAVFYYFMTVFMYLISPRMAYHFSECVETHAYSTYDKFLKSQGEELKKKPAPEVAVKYYTGSDMYLFDEFQTSRVPNTRRPTIDNLYDVFWNIREDEGEHCKTMKACQTHGVLRSPHSILQEEPEDDDSGCVLPQAECAGIVDCLTKSISLQDKQV